MVGDFGWEHEGMKSGVGTVKKWAKRHTFFQKQKRQTILKMFGLV